MARVNIDDDIEAQEEWNRLLKLVGGDRDVAMGKLVRFFRLAQERFGEGAELSKEEIEECDLGVMLQCRWAVPWAHGGYQAKGAEIRFGWYRQRCNAGKKGGRPAKEKPETDSENRGTDSGLRNSDSDNRGTVPVNSDPVSENRNECSDNRNIDSENRNTVSENPPAPVLSLAPSLSQKTNTGDSVLIDPLDQRPETEDLNQTLTQLDKLLKHFKAGRGPLRDERDELWKILRSGIPVEELCHAISGMRFRETTPSFNPGKHIDIFKLWQRDYRVKMISLSTQEAERIRAKNGGR